MVGGDERFLLAWYMICPDGVKIQSKFRHDFQGHETEDGQFFAVDGGITCPRIIGDGEICSVEYIYSTDPIEVIRENMYWGSNGKCGTLRTMWNKIKDLEDDHIDAIIRMLYKFRCDENIVEPTHLEYTFMREKEYRKWTNAMVSSICQGEDLTTV